MVAALIFLLPQELKRFSSSLIAAVFSLSNVWFYAHSSYFASCWRSPASFAHVEFGGRGTVLHFISDNACSSFQIRAQPNRRAGLVRICRLADLERHFDRRVSEELIFSDPHPSLGTVGRQRHRSRTCSGGDVPVAARTRRYRRSDWDRGSDRRFQFTHTVSRLRRAASLFRCGAHHMGR